MAYQIIRWWATLFLRLYFRRTIVTGYEHIPRKGPLIVASNHPSAFMEASVLGTLMGRPLHFLVRGDVFHPRFRWLFNWTNQIPIYRQKDGIANLRKNASSFDLTYQKLAEGNAVLIFPEAKTLLEKKLRPVQRGTAHLGFGALPFLKEGDELRIIPVGVNFMDPTVAGTDLVVRFGPSYDCLHGKREDRDAIEHFTGTLEANMRPLVLQIHQTEDEVLFNVLSNLQERSAHGKADTLFTRWVKMASIVNAHEENEMLLAKTRKYVQGLTSAKMKEAVYFPGAVLSGRIRLFLLFILKCIWWCSGGWIWRGIRTMVMKKIKHTTFYGPTSVGGAMLVFPLLSVLMILIFWLTGVPVWYVLIWWLILSLGKFIPMPLGLMWKGITMKVPARKSLANQAMSLQKEIGDI